MSLVPVTDPTRLNDNFNWPGLAEAIAVAGYRLEQVWPGGVWMTNDAVAVQALIDGYNPLPAAKKDKIREIKVEGFSRINAIFPAIRDFDDFDLEQERWTSIKGTSKDTTPRYQSAIDVFVAARTAITSVNAQTTLAGVRGVTPAWP